MSLGWHIFVKFCKRFNLVNKDHLLPVVEFLDGQSEKESAADDLTLDMSR